MQIETILTELSYPKNICPKEALLAAMEQREKITPALLKVLETTLENFLQVKEEYMGHIYAAYLLAQFREAKAFKYIIEIASLPNSWPEYIFGDFITESLCRIMASTYNGDISLLKRLIEDAHANRWSRGAAINSLLGLIACDRISRKEVIDYFRYLLNGGLSKYDTDGRSYLVGAACNLYPEEIYKEIKNAFDNNQIDVDFIDIPWIEEIMQLGKELVLTRYLYEDPHMRLITNVVTEMEEWKNLEDEFINMLPENFMDEAENEPEISEDILSSKRIFTRVPQQTFCPCGSGKSFKKCCLQ